MHVNRRRTRLPEVALLSAASLALVVGCGSHVDRDRIAAAGNGGGSTGTGVVGGGTDGSGFGSGTDTTGVGTTGTDPGLGSTGTTGSGSVGTTGTTGGGSSGASTTGARGTTTGGPGTTGAGTTGPSAPGGSSTGPGGPVAQPAGSKPCEKELSPVVVGQTLAASGVIGAQVSPTRTGLALWASDINARGGLECHPVKLISQDDGSDPAKAAANFNDLTQNKKAVAIVGAGVPLTMGAIRSAAERDKIPVVGGDGNDLSWWESPYLFPQGGYALSSYDGASVAATNAAKTKAIGLIYCVEAAICTAEKNNFPAGTKKAGLTVGPIKAASLTQTDYTAECQTMKDAGMKAVWVMVDGSAISRVIRSCASLGYRPKIATGAIAIGSAASAKDPNVEQNETFLGSEVAPFTETDTPGGKAFRAASDRYQPGADLDGSTIMGWTSGKLLEKALLQVSAEARAGDITTAMVLKGLWKLKNETLDGLSPGLTFTQGKPAPKVLCYYTVRLAKGGPSAPTGSKKQCL